LQTTKSQQELRRTESGIDGRFGSRMRAELNEAVADRVSHECVESLQTPDKNLPQSDFDLAGVDHHGRYVDLARDARKQGILDMIRTLVRAEEPEEAVRIWRPARRQEPANVRGGFGRPPERAERVIARLVPLDRKQARVGVGKILWWHTAEGCFGLGQMASPHEIEFPFLTLGADDRPGCGRLELDLCVF
jgi:hypothetical protein